jgi:hypothetical protein
MFAKLPKWAKVVGGGLGTIAIGAIGSGVWERLGDPVFVFLRDALLNVGSLGLVTLKDSLYSDVSRGLHESASTRLLGYFFFTLGYAMVLVALTTTRKLRQVHEELAALIDGRSREAKEQPPLEKLVADMRRTMERTKRMIYYGLWPATAVFAVLMGFNAIQTSYTVRAIAHYNQLVTLIGPFVDDGKIKSFNSRFAQIQSGSDYLALTAELAAIAQQHSLKLPDFKPW